MTQDEIISLARQAGVWTEEDDWFKGTKFEYSWKLRIEAFAKLVAERALADHAMSEVQRLGQEIEQERNFCSRCGKRTPDSTHIHTCTPPKD